MTAVTGVETVRPTNLAEACDAMLDAGRERTLLLRGAGTKLDWGAPAHHQDLIVETAGLNRLVAHDPADATATVQAGMPLSELQSQLAASRQWLAIDPPQERATIGGVFAANATGPRRLRYGSMRDLVIGVTVVTADGAVARAGGNVIKNVAGYDLAKLLCGSLGTLGLVGELVIRLHPVPPASRTVTAQVEPFVATQVTVQLLASPLVASAVDWSAGTLAIRIEGRAAGVTEQSRGVRDLLSASGAQPEVVEADDEAAVWRQMADGHDGRDGETVAVAATLPSRFAEVAAALDRVRAETGADAELASHVGTGVHSARLRGGPAVTGAAVLGWRRLVEGLGGHVTVRRRPEQLTDSDVIWGSPPSGIKLMRAVKHRFDPAARCAPGRFVGGI